MSGEKTDCQKFFEANAENNQRCKALQDFPSEVQIAWESQSASEVSPGVVTDNEQLCRHWTNPIHYDDATGTLKLTAFDDAAGIGLSVNRMAHTTLAAVGQFASARVLGWNAEHGYMPQRSLVGYSLFDAKEARQVLTNDAPARRAFGVYDTAKVPNETTGQEGDTSHADVCQLIAGPQAARSLRHRMRDLLAPRLTPFSNGDSPEASSA